MLFVQVKAAHAAKVPFVPATGGHSTWSTVASGLIIDFSHYKEVVVDASQRTVAIRGGVLMKELQLALSENGQFTSMFWDHDCAISTLTKCKRLQMGAPLE